MASREEVRRVVVNPILERYFPDLYAQKLADEELGPDFELREVRRWNVHCAHCGVGLIGDNPQTPKAFEALKRKVVGRQCRNPNCVSRGGTERRRNAKEEPSSASS